MAQFVKGINPGRLNKRVKIYGYTEIETDLGASKTVLAEVAEVWAELKPTRGKEYLELYRDANELSFKVLMRYFPGLTEKHLLVWNDRQFEIDSIINLMEANIYQEIYCTESKDKKVLYEPEPTPTTTPEPTPRPDPEPDSDPEPEEVVPDGG